MDGGSQNAFLELRVCVFMLPDRREVSCELFETSALRVGEPAVDFVQVGQVLLRVLKFSKLLVESLFERVCNESIFGIAEIELIEGAVGLILGSFDLKSRALDLARDLLLPQVGGGDGCFDGQGLERTAELCTDALVDPLGAEGNAASGALFVAAVAVVECALSLVCDIDPAPALSAAK